MGRNLDTHLSRPANPRGSFEQTEAEQGSNDCRIQCSIVPLN